MNQIEKEFEPKKPWPLVLLSFCFLFSPIGNLAIALFVGGHPRWYNPVVWFELFMRLDFSEKVFMLSAVVVAFLLFKQRKQSWFAAVILLVLVSINNLFFSKEVHSQSFQILSFVNISTTLGLLLVLYYFRYPYLDQRDSILGGMAKRVKVHIPVEVDGLGRNSQDVGLEAATI